MLKGNNGRMLKGNSEKTQSCSFCFPSRLHMFQTVCYLSGMFPSVSLVPHGIQCQVPWKNEHVAEISAVIFTTLLAAFSSFWHCIYPVSWSLGYHPTLFFFFCSWCSSRFILYKLPGVSKSNLSLPKSLHYAIQKLINATINSDQYISMLSMQLNPATY